MLSTRNFWTSSNDNEVNNYRHYKYYWRKMRYFNLTYCNILDLKRKKKPLESQITLVVDWRHIFTAMTFLRFEGSRMLWSMEWYIYYKARFF